MIRLGLLGAGRIGRVHAASLHENRNAMLVAVADTDAKAALSIASIYGCEIRSIDEIERSTDIDAVLICTPNDTHASLVERFARSNKAVFCEKPIALDLQRVRECLNVVQAENATLMVGFNRRFDPHFSAVYNEIKDGNIGEIEMLTITSRDPSPPPVSYILQSGGIFRDMTIHDFDMARFLLDEEPVRVMATASVLTDKNIAEAGDWDSASAILATKSGKQCLITNSRRATYGYDQRIEVHGSRGMISAENQRPVSIEIANEKGFHRPTLYNFFMTRYTEAYRNEIATFINSIHNNVKPSPSGEDGFKALALAEAAIESTKTGRMVEVTTNS